MKPSLFSLFKRGKYCHGHLFVGDGDDSKTDEVKREMKEVERFAVAAIAFCLEYDKGFRRHFWNKICRQDGDPKLKDDARFEIEKDNWSDLKIISGDCIAVVEFKAGAPLDDKQNPTSDKFWSEEGYGTKMREEKIKRYTILGHASPLGLNHATARREIICGERSWNDLAKHSKPSKLIQDLFDCLGQIGVKEFRLMKAKKIQVTRAINADAAKAVRIIENLKDSFGFKGKYDSDADENSWWLGSNVEKADSKTSERLSSITGKESWFGWFGFEVSAGAGIQRCVWIYCKDKEHANSLEVSPTAIEPSSWSAGEWNVRISGPIESQTTDYEWFAEVFRQLGLSEH